MVLMFSRVVYTSGTEHNMKLKFRMLTHQAHINAILEYHTASVIIDLNADVLYLKDENVCRLVLKNKTATMFFLKKPFSSFLWQQRI